MPTQKKSVRLSDASLAVLARNGSDLDTAVSRRLNAVLQRYQQVMDSQPKDLLRSREATMVFTDAFTHCHCRNRLGLEPLRIDFNPIEEETSYPFYQDMMETAGKYPNPLIQSNLEEAADALALAVMHTPYQELLYIIEDAERLAAAIPPEHEISIEPDGEGEYSIQLEEAEILLDVSLSMCVQDEADPDVLVLSLLEQDGHEFCGLQPLPESFKEHGDWIASLPIEGPAVYFNRRNLVELSIYILPYTEEAIKEHKAGKVGPNREAIDNLLKEWGPRVIEPVELINSDVHFTEQQDGLSHIIASIHGFAMHHEGPISPIMVSRHIAAYMTQTQTYLDVTESTLSQIRLRLAKLGVEIAQNP